MKWKKTLSTILTAALIFSSFLLPISIEAEAADVGWEIVGNEKFSDGDVGNLNISLTTGVPFVSFWDKSVEYGSATVMKYDPSEGIWKPIGSKRFPEEYVYYPNLYVPNSGFPHIAYIDVRNGEDNK